MVGTAYVVNPETGRQIKVGGPSYTKLIAKYPHLQGAEKVVKSPPAKRLQARQLTERQIKQRAEMPVFKLDIEATAKRAKQPALKRRMEKLVQKKDEPRGSRTRGWIGDAPKKGRERHQVKAQCGDKCFLVPESEGFPICPRCVDDKCSCEVDCRGLTASRVRAKQYKYSELFPAIDRLIEEKKCGK